MTAKELRKEAILVLADLLERQEISITQSILATKESRDSEQKSTSGDKHETSRATTQHELDKLEAQLNKIQQMKAELHKVKQSVPTVGVSFGSYVVTATHHYFVSVGLGNVKHQELNFFAISLASPIGKLLLGKTVGERFAFQQQQVEIIDVA
jgi:transcription elongation GreA/GreB family factor